VGLMPLKMRFSAIEDSPEVSWKKVYEIPKGPDAFSGATAGRALKRPARKAWNERKGASTLCQA